MVISCCGKTSQMALASTSKDARGYAARNDWANGPNSVFLFVMRSFRATRQTVGRNGVLWCEAHGGFRRIQGVPKTSKYIDFLRLYTVDLPKSSIYSRFSMKSSIIGDPQWIGLPRIGRFIPNWRHSEGLTEDGTFGNYDAFYFMEFDAAPWQTLMKLRIVMPFWCCQKLAHCTAIDVL